MNNKITKLVILLIIAAIGFVYLESRRNVNLTSNLSLTDNQILVNDDGGIESALNPLTIESLRNGTYPGSPITIEETLNDGSNYKRYLASYKSEGLTIYALLTVPNGQKPPSGWPVVIFNHGFIPPLEYKTTERYLAYTNAFSRAEYILFKPDYRGHGESEGSPTGAYGANGYTIDVLNAVSSIKQYADADPNRIGMWGHSMGGFITLRSMVTSKDIKAGVIWGGVVGSYPDMLNRWRRVSPTPTPNSLTPTNSPRRWRQALVEEYGTPEANPEFWNSISANSYVADISGPLQLHHGTADSSVPLEFSKTLESQVKSAGKTVELFTYAGDDHNISANLSTALQRSIEFFDRYLKPQNGEK